MRLLRPLPLFLLAAPALGQCNEISKLVPSGAGPGSRVGTTFEIDGDTLAVRAGSRVVIYQRGIDGLSWEELSEVALPPFPPSPGEVELDLHAGTLVVSGRQSVVVFERDLGGVDNWGQAATLTHPNWIEVIPTTAVHGDTVVVGHGWEDGVHVAEGAVYVFERNLGGPDAWGFSKRITPSDPEEGDFFGAALAVEQDTLVVGASSVSWGYACEPGPYPEGKAYVFQRDAGGPESWGEVRRIVSPSPAAWESFGRSVALEDDELLVGAPHPGFTLCPGWPDVTGTGAAYLFGRDEGGVDNWGLVTELVSAAHTDDEIFGFAVDLRGDLALVGAPYLDGGLELGGGGAVTFGRDAGGPGAWGELAVLRSSSGVERVRAGWHVVLDGDRAWLGAYREFDYTGALYEFLADGTRPDAPELAIHEEALLDVDGVYSGAVEGTRAFLGETATDGRVRVFDWSESQGWVEGTPIEVAGSENLGSSMSLSGDRLAVGDNRGTPDDDGLVHVFEWDGASWTPMGSPIASPDLLDDQKDFGQYLDLEEDRLVITDYQECCTSTPTGLAVGRAYSYAWDGSEWVLVEPILPPGAGGSFGVSVDMEGEWLAIGHSRTGTDVGSVHMYRDPEGDGTWEYAQLVRPSDPEPEMQFGFAVALSGTRLAVGAVERGTVHTFVLQGGTWVQEATLCNGAGDTALGWSVELAGDVLVASSYFGGKLVHVRHQGIWLELPQLTQSGPWGHLSSDGTRYVTGYYVDDRAHILRFDHPPTTYCAATVNSTGAPAELAIEGSTSLSANDLVLSAQPVPDTIGFFLFGDQEAKLPFGDGFRCVGGTMGRLPVALITGGVLRTPVDVTWPLLLDLWQAGEFWHLQGWFRDPTAGGVGFNTSSSLRIQLHP